MAATNSRSQASSGAKSTRDSADKSGQHKPFDVLRRGLLKAVIWENQTANGPMFTTQLIRLYKDGEDWKEAHSLNRDDLLGAAKLLDVADTVIHREEERRRRDTRNASDRRD